jgi:CHAT domain-containing protein
LERRTPRWEQVGLFARGLFVCADDLVFLVPLDALPLQEEGEAERVGDRLQVVSEVSFARLISPTEALEAEPSLLVLGGVDYDAKGSTPEGLSGSSPPLDEGDEAEADSEPATSRSASLERFDKLLQTRLEAEATAVLFEDAFELDPILLTKKETTKAALFEVAPGKRYVHLATHGWFAPESVRSIADASSADSTRLSLEDRIIGLAPMTLCGLALAGANRGRDSLGRVPGILTAEELCSLDLSECELAVLSACETNVGIRRAGQGVQSLQAALYTGGARTSITSLWKVDDAATRRLFEIFYTRLWNEKLGKAEALWQAKLALRNEGHPVRDWAGWVLTGDPD